MAIEVYLDESGTHEGSPIVSVSAVWATEEVWANWSFEWIRAKAPVKIHHSVDCHNRSGEFEGWGKDARDEYVMRILPVIRDNYIQGHFASVDTGEIAQLLENKYGITIPPPKMAEGYYSICLTWALRSAWEMLLQQGHSAISFIHENNDFLGVASRVFESVAEKFPADSATFQFGSKAAYPPLQCADILAYEGNKQMRGGFMVPRRKPLQAIDPIGNRFGYLKYAKGEVEPLVDFTASRLMSILEK